MTLVRHGRRAHTPRKRSLGEWVCERPAGAVRLAEERVLAQILEFPAPDRPENIEPADDLESPVSKVPTPHLRLVK